MIDCLLEMRYLQNHSMSGILSMIIPEKKVEYTEAAMTVKEMREKLGITQEIFAQRYNIPKRTIENWESGKRTPPAYVLEMLQKAVEHHVPLTNEEIMSQPLTVVDLKYMCDSLIREGRGENFVYLSDGTNMNTSHGMYYGPELADEADEFVTIY